ncbi:MAG: universal stress protein [Isosphaeraceae bacterium]
MAGFSVILVPTDRRRPATEAMAVARALATRNARLIVLPIDPPHSVASEAEPSQLQELEVPITPPESPGETRRAVEAIIGLADEIACELIVIGTGGLGGEASLWLGEVAQEVLKRAVCPVLCLPASARSDLASNEGSSFASTDFLASQNVPSIGRSRAGEASPEIVPELAALGGGVAAQCQSTKAE